MTNSVTREDWDRARNEEGADSTTSQDVHVGELQVPLPLHADPSLTDDSRTNRNHLARPGSHTSEKAATPGRVSSYAFTPLYDAMADTCAINAHFMT